MGRTKKTEGGKRPAAAKRPTKQQTNKQQAATKERAKRYKKAELEELSLHAIQENELVFIDEIWPFLPVSRSTFYGKGLDKLDTIRDAMSANRVRKKAGLRRKWYDRGHPTTDVALYKLIGTEDECHRLNGSKTESKTEHSGEIKIPGFGWANQ